VQRTPPHSCSAPDSVVPCPPDPDSQRTSVPQGTVLLWDPQSSRRQLVRRHIEACGVRLRCIEDASALLRVKRSGDFTIAVVALEGVPSPGDPSLEGMLRLTRQGFRVICYEDGAQSWPLSVRCQLLLAGSSWLLDSTNAEFASELRCLLTQLLQAEVGRRDEEEQVKRVMKQLGSVGESRAIMAVFQMVCRVSSLSDLPILVTGETGTGKELLARAIYQLDLKRRHGPFVAVNCSAISPGLAESELFGHRRGAFTGADRDRRGLIRSAEGGVLFLDEIGELDDGLQVKLLRVLQENRVLGVGEDREVAISVRIIAATNRDLEAMVQQRAFRADLFHRLHVLAIHIPPLRERPADLEPLIEHFLMKYRFLRPEGTVSVHPDFIAALAQLELPGNARQLENLVRWALVNKDDDTALNLHDLPLDIWQELSKQGIGPLVPPGPAVAANRGQESTPETQRSDVPASIMSLLDLNDWNLSRSLQYCEKLLLEAALQRAQGNQSQAARLLGITPRSVYNKLHKHHLHC
jgi:two-component system, NtrC family, response regulator